jgi:replication fork clamp-binding protein CrfC
LKKKFTDFDEIRAEIERRTDEISGCNKGISKVPINLKIYSPDFLNLTLVDLPGLTRNPTGNQPENIEKILEEMIVSEIEKESCLILAVSPANTDLANSDALKLARRVDPDGKRTIGVLTKLDIMDPGTNARDVFMGKTFALPRGYFGVVSRSQSDIDAGKDINEALKKEAAFFKNHKSYQDIAHRLGTAYLLRKLHCDLGEHIRERLPEFRDQILEKKRDAENTLRRCQKIDLRNGGSNALHK